MAYQPYSGHLKNPFDGINEEFAPDDEFGDFTSAVSFNNSVNQVPNGVGVFFNPIPHTEVDEDEFSEFTSAEPQVVSAPSFPKVLNPVEEHQETVKCRPNYDIDLDFVEIVTTSLPWNQQHSTPQDHQEPPDPEEFTDFTSNTEAPEPLAQTDLLSIEDLTSSPVVWSQPPEILADVFSDFTSETTNQSTSVVVPPVPTTITDSPSDDEEEFSQFESALPNGGLEELGQLEATSTSPPPVDLFAVEDVVVEEEFGDFAQAPEEEQVETMPAVSFDGIEAAQYVSINEISIESTQISWEQEPAIQEPNHNELLDPIEVEVPTEIPIEPVVTPEAVQEVNADDDEFGDFTDFVQAGQEPVEEEEEEFEDFAVAPPPVEKDPPSSKSAAPEDQIQRVFKNLFPILLEDLSVEEKRTNGRGGGECPPSPLNSRGPLWSYVSQLDSTPALSFSWRHSTAHQHFLQSLRIDSILPAAARWNSWSSPVGSNTSSLNESSSFNTTTDSNPAVTLDLDFFLNPSSASTTGNSTSNADSLLQSIERELLSSPAKIVHPPVIQPVQQLNHLFGQLQFNAEATTTTSTSSSRIETGIDLLQ